MKQFVFLHIVLLASSLSIAYGKSDSSSNKLLYNSFQASKVLAGNRQSIWELRTGLYFRNGFVMSGINVGYMHMKALDDTITTTHSQIPVYWSTFFLLGRNPNNSAPYFKLDIGFIASETVYSTKVNKTVPGETYRSAPVNINAASINIGFGCKMAVSGTASGVCVELGYKYLPTLAPGKRQNDFPYITVGYIF